MPPGGDGLYYLYTHIRLNAAKNGQFRLRKSRTVLCVAFQDGVDGNDSPASSCGAVATLVEG